MGQTADRSFPIYSRERDDHNNNLTCLIQVGDDILTPEELAERWKLPTSWVYERVRNAQRDSDPLPFRHVGGYLRFSLQECTEWLDRQPQEPMRRPRRKKSNKQPIPINAKTEVA